MPRKRNSVDLRLLEELTAVSKELGKVSPRDFRKISSPNFRKMSFDRIGGDRRLDRTMGHRKASLEFRRSPDFRRGDYRYRKNATSTLLIVEPHASGYKTRRLLVPLIEFAGSSRSIDSASTVPGTCSTRRR